MPATKSKTKLTSWDRLQLLLYNHPQDLVYMCGGKNEKGGFWQIKSMKAGKVWTGGWLEAVLEQVEEWYVMQEFE